MPAKEQMLNGKVFVTITSKLNNQTIQEIRYTFSENIRINISDDTSLLPLSKAERVQINKITIDKGVLIRRLNVKGSNEDQKECYLLNKFTSYFWFCYASELMEKCFNK